MLQITIFCGTNLTWYKRDKNFCKERETTRTKITGSHLQSSRPDNTFLIIVHNDYNYYLHIITKYIFYSNMIDIRHVDISR
jgi:hypothetical protein